MVIEALSAAMSVWNCVHPALYAAFKEVWTLSSVTPGCAARYAVRSMKYSENCASTRADACISPVTEARYCVTCAPEAFSAFSALVYSVEIRTMAILRSKELMAVLMDPMRPADRRLMWPPACAPSPAALCAARICPAPIPAHVPASRKISAMKPPAFCISDEATASSVSATASKKLRVKFRSVFALLSGL